MTQRDASAHRGANSAWREAFDAQVGASFEITDIADTRVQTIFEPDVTADAHPLLLVEDQDGFLHWVAPEASRGPASRVRFVIDGGSDTRGGGWIVRKAIKILIPRAVDVIAGQAAKFVVGRWEQEHRAPRLRRFGPAAAHLGADSPEVGDLASLVRPAENSDRPAPPNEPMLLLIPGIGATTSSSFGQLAGVGLARLSAAYGERIIGFEHPTLSQGPVASAVHLLKLLDEVAESANLDELIVDVVGHSRGGLVARSLADLIARRDGGVVRLQRVQCVGTPHLGTPLADPKRLSDLLDQLTNLLGFVPLGGIGEAIEGVLAIAQHLAVAAADSLPGLVAMKPDSPYLAGLATARLPASASLFNIASDFEPPADATLAAKARDAIADRLLTRTNDLVVPYDSLDGRTTQGSRLAAHRFEFVPSDAVAHTDYFSRAETVSFLLGRSRGTTSGEQRSKPRAEGAADDDVFEVSVTHASFEGARFHLMVGVYSGETMSAPERFLDRQFDGLLTAVEAADRYPDSHGTAIFLESGREVPSGSHPTGAYLIGLGSTIRLDRRGLTAAVRDALVDRCLRLHADSACANAAPNMNVGVSAALLGVRNDDGLRIEDSVIGTIEAIRQANDALARYENRRGLTQRVRIAHLEFVERYSDRANTAAMAVRSAPAIAGLPSSFQSLTTVKVRSGIGQLPASTSLVAADRTWRRFEITTDPTTIDAGTVAFSVSSHDRGAQAGRATQRVDRASLDALVGRLATDPSNVATLRTLRDRLIPQSMRSDFQTTSALHFLVDPVTANYPWELLAAPSTSGVRATTGTGAVIRTFMETDEPRFRPARAEGPRALVIAAGNVAGYPPLPGVYPECDLVAAALRNARFDVEHRSDSEVVFDIADLNVDLFGNHRILHIASHGEYVADIADKTGAILGPDFRLTTHAAGSFSWVPDLVFLNCCSLGQIGMHRVAAGLAREFMAIGVRAFIAASWPVDDTGAQAFASTFYEAMGHGSSFGDAVTIARTRCAQTSGDHTWAAYQCYGDPGFLLTGSDHGRYRPTDPVSRSDAEARILTLHGKIADFSRPQRTKLVARRDTFFAEWKSLRAWVDPNDEGLLRLLAHVAQDLGEFDEAAQLFGEFVKLDATSKTYVLHQKTASASDLERAANCSIRAVQQAFRRDGSPLGEEAVLRLQRAEQIAKAAVAIHPGAESHGILAGLYKKWATLDPAHRTARLGDALKAYEARRQSQVEQPKSDDPYGRQNHIQIQAIIDRAEAVELLRALGDPPELETKELLTDQDPTLGLDFWKAADAGDRLLSNLMTFGQLDPETHSHVDDLAKMVETYEFVFQSRSTWSERASVIDHLRDLQELLEPDDRRRPWLDDALRQLSVWDAYEVTADEPTGDEVQPTPVASGTVSLTALPAACGDCLVLEYDTAADVGITPARHRMLIDGGLRSAYDRGLGRYLGAMPDDSSFDTVVVTHIDRDHIDGVIVGLERNELRSTDFWFNGFDEISRVSTTADGRGVRQGDQLDKLIPPALRNRAWNGQTVFVTPDAVTALTLPGGARCTLLGPAANRLERLRREWPDPSLVVGDDPTGEQAVDQLVDALGDTAEGASRGPGQFGRDGSVANGSSIAFLFEHLGVSILFTGDAFAADMEAMIVTLLAERGLDKLVVDVFKLSHHGSRQNMTDSLLQLIEPKRVLVCTDGSKFDHPDLDAIEKVRSHYPTVPIYFTDRTDTIVERSAAIDGILPPADDMVRFLLP